MADLDRAGGLLYVPGTENDSATRWIVIFGALRPWIERMRRISLSPPDTRGFVFQTPGRDPNQPPSVKTTLAGPPSKLPTEVRTYLDDLVPHPTEVFAQAAARLQALGHEVILDPFPARKE